MNPPFNRLALLAFLACVHPAWASKGEPGHTHGSADAIGVAGKASEVKRTVKVDMNDAMRFVPASVEVKQGETVRFLITNSGKLKHEFVLGTEKDLKEHYELMKKFPEMEHDERTWSPSIRARQAKSSGVSPRPARWMSAVCSPDITTPA
jgi:uncharacterized cupredoxin-like copper-binding protein